MKSLTMLFAAMTLASCSTSLPPVIQCSRPPSGTTAAAPALVGMSYGIQIAPIPLNSVLFSDTNVAKVVAVQRLGAERTPTNTVEVNAVLANCSRLQVPLRIRTNFYDAEQRATEAPSAWKTVFVPPGGFGSYSELSITRDRVASYLVEITPNVQQP